MTNTIKIVVLLVITAGAAYAAKTPYQNYQLHTVVTQMALVDCGITGYSSGDCICGMDKTKTQYSMVEILTEPANAHRLFQMKPCNMPADAKPVRYQEFTDGRPKIPIYIGNTEQEIIELEKLDQERIEGFNPDVPALEPIIIPTLPATPE